MKLERHVGGLSRERKRQYLIARGWREDDGWSCARTGFSGLPLNKAIHHQLTEDLAGALCALGWRVMGFSKLGYVKLAAADEPQKPVSLPAALRKQARKEKRLVGELTYSLFLAARLGEG